jgi:hypothetical protein
MRIKGKIIVCFLFIIGISEILFSIPKESLNGTRPESMGSAYTAVGGDSYSLIWNPAGLGSMGSDEFLTSYSKNWDDISNYFFSFARPTVKFGTFGGYLNLLDYGTMKERGNYGEILGDFNRKDITAAFSYGIDITEKISVGATTKLRKNSISNKSVQEMGFDLGTILKPLNWLSLGVSIFDIQSKQFGEENTIRIGFSVKPPFIPKLLTTFDIENNGGSFGDYTGLGFEYEIGYLSLRAGVNKSKGQDIMPSFGIGYQPKHGNVKEGMGIEYAMISNTELGQRHLIALKWNFNLETGIFKESRRLDEIIYQKRGKIEPLTVAIVPFDIPENDISALMIHEMFIGFMAQTGVLNVIEVGRDNFASLLEPMSRCMKGIAEGCKEVSFKGAKYLIRGKVERMKDGSKEIQLMIIDMEKGMYITPVSVISDDALLYSEIELLSRKLAHKFISTTEDEFENE